MLLNKKYIAMRLNIWYACSSTYFIFRFLALLTFESRVYVIENFLRKWDTSLMYKKNSPQNLTLKIRIYIKASFNQFWMSFYKSHITNAVYTIISFDHTLNFFVLS